MTKASHASTAGARTPSHAPRRGLRRVEAALYVGISPSMFDKMVATGQLPRPKKFGAASVWDMRQLDLAFGPAPPAANDDTKNDWDD